jgi:hypothetical protein
VHDERAGERAAHVHGERAAHVDASVSLVLGAVSLVLPQSLSSYVHDQRDGESEAETERGRPERERGGRRRERGGRRRGRRTACQTPPIM